MIFFVMIFKVSKNIKTMRALSIFLIILLPFLSLEVCGLSEGKVLIQLSYGNVTTFDMGGQQGDVTQILSLIIIKGSDSTRKKCPLTQTF